MMRSYKHSYFHGRTGVLLRSGSFIRGFLVIFICCLFICPGNTRGQSSSSQPVSPQAALASLDAQYQRHALADTAYLKAMDSIAPLLVRDPHLAQELSTYHQVAFGSTALGLYRRAYFKYLTLNAYDMNKFGSAIYYAKKDYEEAIKAGLIEKGGALNTEMIAITTYFNNRDYAKVFAEYDTLRPVLLKFPAAISAGKVSVVQAFPAFGILNAVVYAAYKTRDTAYANEGILICKKMLEETHKQPEKYKRFASVFNYVYYTLLFQKEEYEGHFEEADHFLQMALGEIRSRDFPEDFKPVYTEDLYGYAFDFYFDFHREDSAQHYLDLEHSLQDRQVQYSDVESGLWLMNTSKLLAARGHFETAYRDLLKGYHMKDSAFYAVSADRDNNLYALAEAENAHNELVSAEAKKRLAQKYSTILFYAIALLIFGGGAWFFLYRSKQRQRLLNLQLNLARNFHDDIGPMLLYANILAKKEAEANPSAGLEELKIQLTYIMEAVRGISHDLKASKLSTVSSFYEDTIILLEKIKSSTQIDFKARINNGGRILSQLQYANLWKIVNELISNSVKHARCSLITLYVKATERDLRIEYADNGKGIALDLPAKGIGIQNMQERVNLLNGEFQLHNAYPEGYSIAISIPLV